MSPVLCVWQPCDCATVLHAAGVLCITRLQCELSDIHSKLMAQNVSLHALLEHTHLELCHSAREEALERRV